MSFTNRSISGSSMALRHSSHPWSMKCATSSRSADGNCPSADFLASSSMASGRSVQRTLSVPSPGDMATRRSDVEALAATAAALLVRVGEGEARGERLRLVVHHRADEEQAGLAVHQY